MLGLPRSAAQDEVWLRQEVSLAAQARRAAAARARRIGLGAERIAEIELAATEIAVNLNSHAVDGALLLRVLDTPEDAAVELLAIDHGPGIADVAYARRDGVSSGGTLGIGLGVVERMADAFDLYSLPGRGTVLVARFYGRAAGGGRSAYASHEPIVAGLTRPLSGETACGDAWAARLAPSAAAEVLSADALSAKAPVSSAGARPLLVMLCDGLGHGPLAARASEQAVAAFHRAAQGDPVEILRVLHQALAGTRGGAVAVAAVDPAARRVRYCGVGNISGFVVAAGRRNTLLSAPGIVGHHLPKLRAFEAAWPVDAALVLHSDGLTERWSPDAMPGLFRRSSTVIAAHLLREAGVRRDDASAVVVSTFDTALGTI